METTKAQADRAVVEVNVLCEAQIEQLIVRGIL
jgi:hypothetical protein